MKAEELLPIIVKALVKNPDQVKVEKTVNEMGTILTIHCDKEDIKYIVGRRGKTFRALRTITYNVGAKNKQKVTIIIHEEKKEKE